MNCLHCGAETTNGLALCGLCQRKASTDLMFLPIYFRNLARWRPGRAGSRPVPGSRVLYDGERRGDSTGDRISDRLDEAANDLTTWARMLADDRGIPLPDPGNTEAEQVTAVCAWLSAHLTSIATLEWCGEFMRSAWKDDDGRVLERHGIGYHEQRLRGLTEQSMPGWYAGACKHCGLATFVVPGLTWVTCVCGSTTYARDHLDTIKDEAQDWVARPMRLAEAIVALVDTEQSVPRLHKRISKWGERGPEKGGILALRRIDADGDEVGPKRFRFGDVLAKLFSEGATRLDATKKRDAVSVS